MPLKIALIREGINLENTIILSFDDIRKEFEPLYESDTAKFLHIANKRILTVQEFKDDYAGIFKFHGLNVIVLDSKGKTQFLYKTDGTIKSEASMNG